MRQVSIQSEQLVALLKQGWKNHKRGKVQKHDIILAESLTHQGKPQVTAMLAALHVCLLGCECTPGHPTCYIQADNPLDALRGLLVDVENLVRMREQRLADTLSLSGSLQKLIKEIERGADNGR